MARLARLRLLPLEVGLVALETDRNVPVPVVMAILASDLGVGTREFLQLSGRSAVALAAVAGYAGIERNAPGGVGIYVAGEAVLKGLPMGKLVATGALGHRLLLVDDMEELMAVLAVETVLPTGFLQSEKYLGMALAALSRGKRLQIDVVWVCGHGRRRSLSRCRRCHG
jgi:hypothetical protein